MKLKVKLELRDYRKWNMEYFYSGLRGKMLIVISAVIVLTTGYYAAFAGRENLAKNPQIIFVMALGMLFLLMMPVSIFMQSKKVFESDKLLQEEQEYEFCDDKFTVKALSGVSEITWDKIYNVKITKSFISLYLSNIRAFVIPCRLLAAGGKDELKKMLKSKIRIK